VIFTDTRRNTQQSSWTATYLITEAHGVLQFCNTYFFYLYLDYKHKHTADQRACYVVHAKIYFFYLYLDYKHKRELTAAKPRATHNFIDSPYYIGY